MFEMMKATSFVDSDRTRVEELQSEMPSTPATARPVTPARAGRHGIAERHTGLVGTTRVQSSPVDSNNRGLSREPPHFRSASDRGVARSP